MDVRFIAATNKDLKNMVDKGDFREDLYYRLNVIPINIPPLRERKEDIIPLAELYSKKIAKKRGGELKFTPEAKEALLQYSWPGNVRELENIIERIAILNTSNKVLKEDLPITKSNPDATGSSLNEKLDMYECEIMREAIKNCNSTREVAKVLNISQTSVVRKLKKHKLDLNKNHIDPN